MIQDIVFSWAENKDGRMVHVDTVPKGLNCGCICPNCHEQLLARKGKERKNHFAHHSDNRGANLKICYQVAMYKLAEQIIQTKKRIHLPSYYDIFQERDIHFVDVEIDGRYEREDKQPDVIAKTDDGNEIIIEFTFKYKTRHKRAVDFIKHNCVEINLSNQKLETLEEFLLSSKSDRRWLNNEVYFNRIEETYRKHDKAIKVVPVSKCNKCPLRYNCCAIMKEGLPLQIENNAQMFRLCKTEIYEKRIEELAHPSDEDSQERSCYQCILNLDYANKDGLARCGAFERLNIPRFNPPTIAKNCKLFNRKCLYT